jgi:hypothetical protein
MLSWSPLSRSMGQLDALLAAASPMSCSSPSSRHTTGRSGTSPAAGRYVVGDVPGPHYEPRCTAADYHASNRRGPVPATPTPRVGRYRPDAVARRTSSPARPPQRRAAESCPSPGHGGPGLPLPPVGDDRAVPVSL